MGAGSSQAPHAAEVRLECPRAQSSAAFFARLHSAAHGGQRYKAWGKPQIVGLLPDDIITVSIFTAQSEKHFENLDRAEFAEVYLPWDVVSEKIADGVEEVFVLGLQPGSPWLGENAQPAHYRSAYSWACSLARDDPSVPRIRIGVRAVSHLPHPEHAPAGEALPEGTVAAPIAKALPAEPPPVNPSLDAPPLSSPGTTYSAAVACGSEELSPDEMKRLFQLQVKNKELLAQLRLREGDEPDVEDQVREHLIRLRRAVSQNYALRAALQREDRELAELSSALTPEQHVALTGVATPVPTDRTLTVRDEQDYERQAEALMGEIQAVTTGNIELIARFDHQITLLEADLVGACQGQRSSELSPHNFVGDDRLRSQRAELDGLEGECAELEAALVEGVSKQSAVSSVMAQKLQLELEVQEEEIGNLRQILERQQAERPPMPPSTGVLQDQLSALQADLSQEELRSRDERRSMEQQGGDLRRESLALKDELDFVYEAKAAAESELESLRARPPQSSTSIAALELEQADEEVRMESLDKELTRCRRRIEFHDEKIGQLQEEADDLRQRAAFAGPGNGEAAGAHVAQLEAVAELEAVVSQVAREVELAKHREEQLRAEKDEVQQAFEMAKVQDRLMVLRTQKEVR